MKHISYMANAHCYGERCRLFIIFGRLYLAISRDRFRIVLDITF